MFTSKKTCQVFLIQLIATQLLFAGESISQNLADVKLNFEIKDAKLKEAFSTLEKSTQFKFGFDKKILDSKARFSISEQNISVEDILLKIAEEANLRFKRFNNQVLVMKDDRIDRKENKILVIEEVDISGKITDENGQGLPGVPQ